MLLPLLPEWKDHRGFNRGQSSSGREKSMHPAWIKI